MNTKSSASVGFALSLLLGHQAHAAVFIDSTPTPDDFFGTVGSDFGVDLTRSDEYYGIGEIGSTATTWAIGGIDINTTALPTAPAPNSNSEVLFGRGLRDIDTDGDGVNEDFRNIITSWELTIPASAGGATNLTFSLNGGISDADWEPGDSLGFDLGVVGFGLLSSFGVDFTAIDSFTGDGSLVFSDPNFFAFTGPFAGETVIVDVYGGPDFRTEAFWLTGTLRIAPEPSRAMLLGLGLMSVILRRRRD